MKRTCFARKAPVHKPAAPLKPLTRPVNCERIDGKARLTLPIPKAAPNKPGKRAPTKAESEWMDAITRLGCIACHIDGHPGTPGAVHHLLFAGQRRGHMHTICLCDPGHHQDGQQLGKVSRHPWKARFEAQYGTEDELLDLTQQLVLAARLWKPQPEKVCAASD